MVDYAPLAQSTPQLQFQMTMQQINDGENSDEVKVKPHLGDPIGDSKELSGCNQFVQNPVVWGYGGYGGQIITENGILQKRVGKFEINLQS